MDFANLDILVRTMEAAGRDHLITKAFLQQLCLDIERNGLASSIKLTNLGKYQKMFDQCSSTIPLLARSKISKHTQVAPPLPGRLPLGNPVGNPWPRNVQKGDLPIVTLLDESGSSSNANKRKRNSPGSTSDIEVCTGGPGYMYTPSGVVDASQAPLGVGGISRAMFTATFMRASEEAIAQDMAKFNLPHRGSPRLCSPPVSRSTPTQSGSDSSTPGVSAGVVQGEPEAHVSLPQLQTPTEDTDFTSIMEAVFNLPNEDPWGFANGEGDMSWETGETGPPGG